MKNLLTILFLTLAISTHAQLGTHWITDGGTNVVPTGASNLLAAPIYAPYSKNVNVQTTFKLHAAGTAGVTFIFDSSQDNSNWAPSTHRFWVAGNGTTEVSYSTNFTLGGMPFWRLAAVHNTNNSPVTNLLVTTHIKRGL